MAQLCDHCGHSLPNAAGPDLYCSHCGEPVAKGTRTATRTPRVEIDPRDLIVTYGTREQGEKGYILCTRVYRSDATRVDNPRTVVFESDRKSEVIAESQRRKGWYPVDGSERTYAQQIAEHDGEAR